LDGSDSRRLGNRSEPTTSVGVQGMSSVEVRPAADVADSNSRVEHNAVSVDDTGAETVIVRLTIAKTGVDTVVKTVVKTVADDVVETVVEIDCAYDAIVESSVGDAMSMRETVVGMGVRRVALYHWPIVTPSWHTSLLVGVKTLSVRTVLHKVPPVQTDSVLTA